MKLLYNTDFFIWAKDMPNGSFDTIITDPPYGSFAKNKLAEKMIKEKSFDLEKFCNECYRLLSSDGLFISFCSIHLLMSYARIFRGKMIFICEQIWDKRPTSTWVSWHKPLRFVEYIVYYGKSKNSKRRLDFRNGRTLMAYNRGVFGSRFNRQEANVKNNSFSMYGQIVNFRVAQKDRIHPVEKPKEFSEMFRRVIKNPGRVLDPCCGSGNLICKFENAIGIDIGDWK